MSKKRIRAVKVVGWRISDARLDGPSTHYVLPATVDAYEQMVEQMVTAVHLAKGVSRGAYISTLNEQRAALRAIGITPPKKGTT